MGHTLILRRRPFSPDSIDQLEGNILGLSLVDEAAVIQLATLTSVPSPKSTGLDATHPIGEAFLAGFIPGESIPQRLVDDAYEVARRQLAFHVVRHSGASTALTAPNSTPILAPPHWQALCRSAKTTARIWRYLSGDAVRPELAIDHAPTSVRVLLHGDFRTGNLLVDEQGLAGVLDWGLTHQGPAEEDLGYLCANVWRFGQLHKPVGGFGDYET